MAKIRKWLDVRNKELSMHLGVHVKSVKIWTLAEHTSRNLFGVDSVCDEIVSAYAQQAMKSFLRMLSQLMLKFLWSTQKKA